MHSKAAVDLLGFAFVWFFFAPPIEIIRFSVELPRRGSAELRCSALLFPMEGKVFLLFYNMGRFLFAVASLAAHLHLW